MKMHDSRDGSHGYFGTKLNVLGEHRVGSEKRWL